MLTKRINITLAALLVFILAACSDVEKKENLARAISSEQSRAAQENYQALLFNKKGEQLLVINQIESVKTIASILDTRKKTFVKILPLFENRLVLKTRQGQNEWWISSRYIKNASQMDAPLMVIDSETDFLSLVKSLSR